MAITPRLDLRQGQTLVMTPQLQQSIKLLQMNNIDLSLYVEEELAQNPFLERDETQDVSEDRSSLASSLDPTSSPDKDALSSETPLAPLERIDFSPANDSNLSARDSLDVDYDNLFSSATEDSSPPSGPQAPFSSSSHGHTSNASQRFNGETTLEDTLSKPVSLRDHLTEQIAIELTEPQQRLIALHLMELLDETGYLRGDLTTVSQSLNCPLDDIEDVLSKVKLFDPPGIFARNLSECLAAQLMEKNHLDPAMQLLLDNLDLLAQKNITALVKICGVDQDDIHDMIAEIKSLSPKPALAFDTGRSQPIIPDVLMHPRPGEGWFVELNTETLPRVLINNQYYADIGRTANRKDKLYLSESFQSASWLVKSLHQRSTTILKIATEIVRRQDSFFRQGIKWLKPMILKDIAQTIEMHESTVSRATSNKYISTPRGIFELKYFFTQSIRSSTGGEDHSAEAVRYQIKKLINDEDPGHILSDDKIKNLLKKEGINIARRTVAKYREELKISSSSQRRREKMTSL